MVRHIGEGLQEDRFHAGIRRVVITGLQVIFFRTRHIGGRGPGLRRDRDIVPGF